MKFKSFQNQSDISNAATTVIAHSSLRSAAIVDYQFS